MLKGKKEKYLIHTSETDISCCDALNEEFDQFIYPKTWLIQTVLCISKIGPKMALDLLDASIQKFKANSTTKSLSIKDLAKGIKKQ